MSDANRMKWWQWPLVVLYGIVVCGAIPVALIGLANLATTGCVCL